MLRSCSSRLLGRGRTPLHTLLPRTRTPSQALRPVATRGFADVVTPKAREPTELDNVTALPNGIRVASEALPGAFSGVGVYIDAGSRYETEYLRGASHIMDRLAFKSTHQRSADDMLEAVENLGGNIQCASSRESMMYQAATFNAAIPTTVGLLADTIRNPRLADDEISQQLETAQYEINEIWSKPELILPELVHMAAFKDNTIGNPLLCPQERLADINRNVIEAYRDAFYRPEHMVVAFAGVPHVEAVQLTEQYFGDMKKAEVETEAVSSTTGSETTSELSPSVEAEGSASSFSSAPSSHGSPVPTPPQQPSKLLSKIPFFKNLSTSAPRNASVLSSSNPQHLHHLHQLPQQLHQPSRYTGGFLSLPPQPPPLNPNMPTFTHIQLAFEGLPILADDIYALAALQTLLGGGGSFSAGGPGKGMYSRLYTNVLNQHGWVESCVAFNHSYTDTGLFGIAASCYPGRTAKMLEVMCRELRSLTLESGYSALNKTEVERAKNQLRSSLLMNLESRMIELEDLGRQVQVHGRKVPVLEMTRKINALTVADLRRAAQKVVGGMVENPGRGTGAPTVVIQEASVAGMATKQITWDEIQDMIYQWKLGRR